MAYNDYCKGSASVDRSSTSYSGYHPSAYIDEAYGQRFVPTSRCLDSVTLRLRRLVDEDVYVEIRNDDSGKPKGMPGPGGGYLGRYLIPYTSIPTSFTNIDIPFGIVLDNTNPRWIVIYSRRFDPNYFESIELFELDGDLIDDNVEYTSRYCGTCIVKPKEWVNSTNVKFYFKTFKKTYTEPPPSLSCNFTVT